MHHSMEPEIIRLRLLPRNEEYRAVQMYQSEFGLAPTSMNECSALSPRESSNSWYKVKMQITAYNGENMLTAKCSNPEVIARDRPSLPLKFQAEGRVRLGGLLVDVEDSHGGNPLLQPLLVANSMTGLGNPETVFT